MERLAQLPLAVRIAIGAGIAIALFLVLYAVALRGDGMTVIETYPSKEHADASQWRLSQVVGEGGRGIPSAVRESGGQWQLRVPSSLTEQARMELGLSKQGLEATSQCGEGGMLQTSSAQREIQNCKIAREIESRLSNESGILAAYAIVTPANTAGFGSRDGANASIQLVAEPGVDLSERGHDLAKFAVHSNPQLTMQSVFIRTQTGLTIYDPQGSGAGAGGERCATASDNIHDLTRCVNAQVASEIEADLARIVGDAEKVTVIAWVDLTAGATQSTVSDLAPVVLNRNRSRQTTRSGSSSSVTEDTREDSTPSATITSKATPPGVVEQLRLSVTLKDVDRTVERAVRDTVAQIVVPDRDPAPVVRNLPASAAGDATDGSGSAAAGAASEASEAGASATPGSDEIIRADLGSMSIALGAIALLLGGITALMWRRSRRLEAERRVFEDEFRNDMTRFQTVASRNPDELAQEIETWLAGQSPQGTGRPS